MKNRTEIIVTNWGKYFLMGLAAIILSSSVFMTIFTPFPLAVASLFFGRLKGLILILLSGLTASFLTYKGIWGVELLTVFLFSLVLSQLLTEIILRGINPIRGFITVSSFLFFALMSLLMISAYKADQYFNLPLANPAVTSNYKVVRNLKAVVLLKLEEVKDTFEKQKVQLGMATTKELNENLDFLFHPEKYLKKIVFAIPASLFTGIIFLVWINLFLLLRISKMYPFQFHYTERSLLGFKVHELVVWLVIAGLALSLAGDKSHENYELAGRALLQCLGIFYFFQGLGIFFEFLEFIKMEGMIQSMFVLFTVMSGWWIFQSGGIFNAEGFSGWWVLIGLWILVGLGLFDAWVDFRKFFKNNQSKGESI